MAARSVPGFPPFLGQGAALCAGADPEAWFPEGGKPAVAAKEVCQRCELMVPCAEWATRTRQAHGIWGATTPDERLGRVRRR